MRIEIRDDSLKTYSTINPSASCRPMVEPPAGTTVSPLHRCSNPITSRIGRKELSNGSIVRPL